MRGGVSGGWAVPEYNLRGEYYETYSERSVERRFEGGEGQHLNGQRSAYQHALFFRNPICRGQGHQSRGASGCRARRLLHDGPFGSVGRGGTDGGEAGKPMHHYGWKTAPPCGG